MRAINKTTTKMYVPLQALVWIVLSTPTIKIYTERVSIVEAP